MQCFVAMPYGQKTTQTGKTIDFDAIYADLVLPAIDETGFSPVRVEDFGTSNALHQDLVRSVASSELFVADVTLPNPNVFWELGVRHALSPRGTVLISAEGSPVAFDLTGAPIVFYPADGSDGSRLDETRLQLRLAIEAATASAGDVSPVASALPGLEKRLVGMQKTGPTRSHVPLSSKQRTIEKLRSYTSTDEITAKLRDVESRGDELASDTPGAIKTVLDAYRAAGDWEGLIRYVEKLDPEIAKLRQVRQELALALSRLGDNERAITVLEEALADYPNDPEILGLLGRIHRELGNEQGAVDLYTQALELDPTSTYAGLQAAKLIHAMRGPDDPQLATLLQRTRSALMDQYDGYPKTAWDIWDLSKDLELWLLASEWREAFKTANVIAESSDTWAIRSIRRTVAQYTDRFDDENAREQLRRIDEALGSAERLNA